MNKQVLILNITRMGDLVQMGPLLARLQHEWPGVGIDLVVDRRFAPVAELLPGLRHIEAYDFHALIDDSRARAKDVVALYRDIAAWAKPLAETGYDRIVNLTFNKCSGLLAGYVGASDIRGVRSAWDGGPVVENPWMAYFTDMHLYRRFNRFNLVDIYALGGSGIGPFSPLQITVPADAADWARRFLASEPATATQWVAVQAGASDVMKAWRPEYFGRAMAFLSRTLPVGFVLIGTASEQDTIAQVKAAYRDAGGRAPLREAVGRTSLPQLVGLLAECRMLLTNDTGPMHLAVAVGTPVVDLSVGHVDFRETGPYGPGHWVVQPELDCAPCSFDQVCFHHSCKDRVAIDGIAMLSRHVLQQAPAPVHAGAARLYQSGVDEDGLATYRLIAGAEHSTTAWYASFWRRYWYEAFTGTPSRTPAPTGPPPDLSEANERLSSLLPLLDRLCRHADDIVRVASRRPVPVETLKALQAQLGKARQEAVTVGMESPATAPPAVSFLRDIHNDNIQGLERLARHHAHAYGLWRTRVKDIQTRLRGFTGPSTQTPLQRNDVAGPLLSITHRSVDAFLSRPRHEKETDHAGDTRP